MVEELQDLNSRNVRKEYVAYSDREFAAGRLAFLTEFLTHPIYHSKCYSHLEDAARENMKRELEQCKLTIARPLSYALLRTRNLDLASGSTESQRLGALVGKTVDHVLWHNSHGDVLEIVFTDGTRLCTCTFAGAETKYLNPDINDLYVSINGQEL